MQLNRKLSSGGKEKKERKEKKGDGRGGAVLRPAFAEPRFSVQCNFNTFEVPMHETFYSQDHHNFISEIRMSKSLEITRMNRLNNY